MRLGEFRRSRDRRWDLRHPSCERRGLRAFASRGRLWPGRCRRRGRRRLGEGSADTRGAVAPGIVAPENGSGVIVVECVATDMWWPGVGVRVLPMQKPFGRSADGVVLLRNAVSGGIGGSQQGQGASDAVGDARGGCATGVNVGGGGACVGGYPPAGRLPKLLLVMAVRARSEMSSPTRACWCP